MKILLVGGTGFISKRIVQNLVGRGYNVTIFNRGLSANPFELNKRVNCVIGNRDNENDLKKVLMGKKYDVVYDMIAYTENHSRIITNILKGKIGRFIHCSTISVYMISDAVHCPITEDQYNRKVMKYFARNPFGMDYGINKRKCEEILWSEHNDKTFPVTMLRPTFVAGPEDPSKRDYFWIQRILDGKPLLVPGSGDFAFQQVFIDDVAKAFCDLLDHDITIGNAYNVAAEEIFSLNEYLGKLSELLNVQPDIVHIDQENFDRLDISYFPGGDVFPYNTRRTSIFSLEKIKKDISYKSTPFKVWMPKTIEWFVKNNKDSIGYDKRQSEIELIKNLRNKHKNYELI